MVERPKVYSEHMLNRIDGTKVPTTSIEQGIHLPISHTAIVYPEGFSIVDETGKNKPVLHGEKGKILAHITHMEDGVYIKPFAEGFGEVY
jgi:hypothetical protein